MLHLQAVDLSSGERHRQVLAGTAEFATEPSSVSVLRFLSRNTQTLKSGMDERCDLDSVDAMLSFAGDGDDKTSTTTMNLTIDVGRGWKVVRLSIGDDDGRTESGIVIDFDVNVRTGEVANGLVNCFISG